MEMTLAEWIAIAIKTIEDGMADKFEKDNVKVYRVTNTNVIRVDYKTS